MDVPTWFLLYLLAIGMVVLGLAVWVFKLGTRDRFITRRPFLNLAFWTIGLQILVALANWLIGDELELALPIELLATLAFGAAIFTGGAAIWLAGFAYGRWRASRSEGVISRSRRPVR